MNTIHKYLTKLLLTLSTSAILFSCVENPNNWVQQSEYDRMFRPSSFTVTNIDFEKITLAWRVMPGVKEYELQLSEKSDFSGDPKTLVTTVNSVNVINLKSATTYYFRVRSLSPDGSKPHSNYSTYTARTKADQIIQKVGDGDIWDNQIVVRWTNTDPRVLNADKLKLFKKSGESSWQEITEQSIPDFSVKESTLTSLDPQTNYKVELYNNGIVVGFKNYLTKAAIPTDLTPIYIASDTELNDVLTTGGAQLLPDGKYVVVINTETELTQSSSFDLPLNCELTLMGNPRMKRPRIKVKTFWFDPSETNNTSLTFRNLYISNNGDVKDLLTKGGMVNVQKIEIDDCFMTGIGNCLIRLQSASAVVENLIIHNSVFYSAGGSDFITCASGGGKYTNISVSKSTFFESVGRSFFRLQGDNFLAPQNFTVSDCTFDTFLGTGKYPLFDLGEKDHGILNNVSFTNCIFGKTKNKEVYGIRFKSGSYGVVNCFKTNDFSVIKYHFIGQMENYESPSTSLFKKNTGTTPETLDLTIKDVSFAGRFSSGDPRWYPEQ